MSDLGRSQEVGLLPSLGEWLGLDDGLDGVSGECLPVSIAALGESLAPKPAPCSCGLILAGVTSSDTSLSVVSASSVCLLVVILSYVSTLFESVSDLSGVSCLSASVVSLSQLLWLFVVRSWKLILSVRVVSFVVLSPFGVWGSELSGPV